MSRSKWQFRSLRLLTTPEVVGFYLVDAFIFFLLVTDVVPYYMFILSYYRSEVPPRPETLPDVIPLPT